MQRREAGNDTAILFLRLQIGCNAVVSDTRLNMNDRNFDLVGDLR
jgi:hypothetical protein